MTAARVGHPPPDMARGAGQGAPRSRAAAKPLVSVDKSTGKESWHAVATAYGVVGTRGRRRTILLVTACPFCRCSHQHSAAPDFESGKRTAACHGGRYTVIVGAREGVSA